MKNSRFINWLMTLALVALIALGIGLFFVRNALLPGHVGHELSISPHTSSPSIFPQQFLVLIHPNHLGKLESILKPLGLRVKLPLLNWILVGNNSDEAHGPIKLQSDQASLSRLTLNALRDHPLVLDAHHSYAMEPTGFLDGLDDEWQFFEPSPSYPFAMDLLSAWKITTGSKDVTIALIDHFTVNGQFNFGEVFSGCKDRVRFFSPFTYQNHYQTDRTSLHGEALLLALGACNNVHPFSAGIDEHAQILAAEPPTFGHGEIFFTALLAGGIDVCKESVVSCPPNLEINAPQSTPDVLLIPFGNNAPDLLQISADMTFALNQKGVIVVTGAGNDQANANNSFPGASPYVINVGAIDKGGERTAFSNWGLSVDLMAPGADLDFIFPNGKKNISGTSVSAAFVAGAISLLKSLKKRFVL